ncbi:uncharacterized protein LOC122503095 [Leptopilina heterotoma]|uniref:uncharacterized protein LOC122503095 n=1 Tax=Leptopilina heterotoma TaxID=63436 RepID=UPI001CA8F237|nr:uncharacterized protein LOC122503095 [Leptopilina heterotoma]
MNKEKQALVRELHKPDRRNYARRKVDIRAMDDTWKADLVDMLTYAKKNRNYKYILTIIDNFSKLAWAVPVKNKSGENISTTMNLQGSYKWLDILQDLLFSYNNTKHQTIKMKPKDVNKNNEKAILFNVYKTFVVKSSKKKPKFEKEDKVRISKLKHIFEKGYTPNWTTEIFTIDRVNNTTPVTYLLRDYQNRPLAAPIITCFVND